ncbi:hypothetical protein ALPO108162_07905 [Alicyclobacillus pomorum]
MVNIALVGQRSGAYKISFPPIGLTVETGSCTNFDRLSCSPLNNVCDFCYLSSAPLVRMAPLAIRSHYAAKKTVS